MACQKFAVVLLILLLFLPLQSIQRKKYNITAGRVVVYAVDYVNIGFTAYLMLADKCGEVLANRGSGELRAHVIRNYNNQ